MARDIWARTVNLFQWKNIKDLERNIFIDEDYNKYLGSEPTFNTLNVLANTNLETGTFINNTTSATNLIGSTFNLFNAITIGASAYIGADNPFYGILIDIDTIIALGSGNIISEIWTGSNWDEVKISVVRHNTPNIYYKNIVFENAQKDDIRLGNTTGWATKVINNITKYWMRFRVVTDIITSPIIKSIRVIGNCTKIGTDGVYQYFGTNIKKEIIDQILPTKFFRDIAGNSPSNNNILYAKGTTLNIKLKLINNSFINGSLDGIGAALLFDDSIDGSLGMLLTIKAYYSNTDINPIEFEINYDSVIDGDILKVSSRTANWFNDIFNSSGIQDQRFTKEYRIPMDDVANGDTFVFNLLRDARVGNMDDLFTGDLIIEFLGISVYRWRD